MAGPDSFRGSRVGHYLVESLVSSGGFGVVYRVTRDGKPYALKLPLMDDPFEYHADRKVLEQRFTREVIALMTLKHPNIVRVHGFDRWPNAETGALYLVMDFVEGLPLLQWRAQALPTLREVVEVFRTLGLALAEMHRLGVVHRDLKSSNILVSAETDTRFPARWKPVIVDFGLARPAFTHDVTREHALLGTEGLWAPEQLKTALQLPDAGGSPYSAASDLHALGLLFYETLTGRRAFLSGGGKLAALLTTVPRAPSVVNRALPECLDATVLQLLAQNPTERHANGADLADELGALLEQQDPRWDDALAPGEPTADTVVPAVTACERPAAAPSTRQDFAPSLLDPSSIPPFFPRHSDVLRTISVTAPVPHLPASMPARAKATVPAPLRRKPWPRWLPAGTAACILLIIGATALARALVRPRSDIATAPSVRTPARAGPQPIDAVVQPVLSSVPGRQVGPTPLSRRATPTGKPSPQPATARVSVRAVLLGRVQDGPTEVTLVEPLLSGSRVVLPAGTFLVGAGETLSNGAGYQLAFDTARLPTLECVSVRASAFAEPSAGRRQPLRAGAPPSRMELTVLFELPGS